MLATVLVSILAACSASGDADGTDTNSGEQDIINEATAPDLVSYPEGPFGIEMGQVIADLGFYDPATEGTVYLHQWYQHPEARVLLIISTAAW